MTVIGLLDNDATQARLICDNLEIGGLRVVVSSRVWDGLLMLKYVHPDLILLNTCVDQWTEFLILLRAIRGFESTPLILVCSQRPARYYLRKWGISTCIDHHFDSAALVNSIQVTLFGCQKNVEMARQ